MSKTQESMDAPASADGGNGNIEQGQISVVFHGPADVVRLIRLAVGVLQPLHDVPVQVTLALPQPPPGGIVERLPEIEDPRQVQIEVGV